MYQKYHAAFFLLCLTDLLILFLALFVEKFNVEKLLLSFIVNINFGVLSSKPYNVILGE